MNSATAAVPDSAAQPPTLAQFQAGFSGLLLAPLQDDSAGADASNSAVQGVPGSAQQPAWLVELAGQPGFAVYRNTVLKGCIDALQANYPAVARLVGEAWFRAAAAIHVRAHPPGDARLMHYGADFADFLAQFPPAAELAYLAPVARVERCWTECHLAADAPTLAPAVLASLPEDALGTAVLQVHPATRWTWCADAPVRSIWQANRVLPDSAASNADDAGAEIEWVGEGVLLTRRDDGAVASQAIGPGGCAFLQACAAGAPLAEAAGAAMEAEPALDLSQLLAALLQAGAFSALVALADVPSGAVAAHRNDELNSASGAAGCAAGTDGACSEPAGSGADPPR